MFSDLMFHQDERCGMLIPRPQYPLYSAALTMVGGRIVYYDMYEETPAWIWTVGPVNQDRLFREG